MLRFSTIGLKIGLKGGRKKTTYTPCLSLQEKLVGQWQLLPYLQKTSTQ
jgi:hypothetical protein